MGNEKEWCFSWFVDRKLKDAADKAALVKAAKWNPGDIITISFLDGDSTSRDKVEHYAKQWIGADMANVDFDFRNNNNTLIRISFMYSGNWSAVGTTCRTRTDTSMPTMNFGGFSSKPEDRQRRHVLHEFGHALGLIHEHQHPEHGIKWDRDAVMRDLSGPPNSWSVSEIEQNMFQPYTAADTNFSEFDPESIMLYPIPSTWTIDGFSVDLNTDLSEKDREFIREQYPQ